MVINGKYGFQIDRWLIDEYQYTNNQQKYNYQPKEPHFSL